MNITQNAIKSSIFKPYFIQTFIISFLIITFILFLLVLLGTSNDEKDNIIIKIILILILSFFTLKFYHFFLKRVFDEYKIRNLFSLLDFSKDGKGFIIKYFEDYWCDNTSLASDNYLKIANDFQKLYNSINFNNSDEKIKESLLNNKFFECGKKCQETLSKNINKK